MQNPLPPTPATRAGAASSPSRTPTHDNTSNEQIKELLRTYGLRTSLIRLKVIDALLNAAENDRALGVRGVHSQLLDLDIPLSFLSVREVLKRLCSEGVIELNSDKSYRLNPQAFAALHGE